MRSRMLVVSLIFALAGTAACGSGEPSSTWKQEAAAAESASPSVSPSAKRSPKTKPPATTPAQPEQAADPVPARTPARQPTKKPEKQQATVRPELPAGSVPDFLVGEWYGGPGGDSGRYLTITSDGRYERGYASGGIESSGTVVATSSTATFHDRSGVREKAGLAYTDAAGIIVLSVDYAEQGYYSYVAN